MHTHYTDNLHSIVCVGLVLSWPAVDTLHLKSPWCYSLKWHVFLWHDHRSSERSIALTVENFSSTVFYSNILLAVFTYWPRKLWGNFLVFVASKLSRSFSHAWTRAVIRRGLRNVGRGRGDVLGDRSIFAEHRSENCPRVHWITFVLTISQALLSTQWYEFRTLLTLAIIPLDCICRLDWFYVNNKSPNFLVLGLI